MSTEATTPFDQGRVTSEDRVATKKRAVHSDTVVCTACSQRLDAYRLDWMRRHPLLDVLLCKRCYMMHTSREIQVGEDGMDEACRWCALEGDLICCDFCHNVFCKLCIRRNLGRAHLNIILNADEDQKWQCYVCNPEPLAGLVGMCTEILQAAEEEYESKPPHKKPLLSSDQLDEGGMSPIPPSPPRPRRGRKPGSTLVKKSLDMLKKENEAISEAELDEIVGRMEEGESEELVYSADDPDFTLEEAPQEGAEKKPNVTKDNEVVYVKTPTGEIVALKAAPTSASSTKISKTFAPESVAIAPAPVQKRPKGRPRIHPPKEGQTLGTSRTQSSASSAIANTQGKKYPRSGNQHKNTPGSLAAMAGVKLSSRPPNINEQNIWFVLEKLLASTQSMTMLLASLKEDLKRATTMAGSSGGSSVASRNLELRNKRCEVSVKLWRAFLAYKKSFVDLEVSSKNTKMRLEMSEFYEDGVGDYEYYNEDDYDETDAGIASHSAAAPGEEDEGEAAQGEEEAADDDMQQENKAVNGSQLLDQSTNMTLIVTGQAQI